MGRVGKGTRKERERTGEGKSQPTPTSQVLPVHTRCHSNAALSHHFLDAFQSHHLGLCNGIDDIFCRKFVQIWRGESQVSWTLDSRLHFTSVVPSNTLVATKPRRTMAWHESGKKTTELGAREPWLTQLYYSQDMRPCFYLHSAKGYSVNI